MNLKPIASNMTEVKIGNKTVLFSYQTPVAYFDGKDVYKTEKNWSRTTNKHITKWLCIAGLAHDLVLTKPQEHFDNLLEEVK